MRVLDQADVVGVRVLVTLLLDDSQVPLGSQVAGHRGLAVTDEAVPMTGEQ